MYLTVIQDRAGKAEKSSTIPVQKGESIIKILTRNHIYLTSPCGGNGSCGKCRVQVIKGELAATDADRRFLSEEELAGGIRLACRAYIQGDLTIAVKEEEEFEVLTGVEPEAETEQEKGSNPAVAIDIGTTTIALALIDVATGNTIRTMGELNRQRSYGQDVVSRIAASNEGAAQELTSMIRSQLSDMLKRLNVKELSQIVIAANTTMCHILMGYSCEKLGVYPFEPVNIHTIHTTSQELFSIEIPDCEVVILPGISTYVGADIVSGLVQCGFADSEDISVLIDLGTNGEMAIGNRDRILVTSAAAGPAFEGGNIKCGTGSVPGAVSAVDIQYGRAKVETIQNKTPVGICGSGVVELTAELLKNERIDETGALDEDYFEDGYPVVLGMAGKIVFTQKDIREIQMAKSAVASALELLTKRYGIKMEEVDKVYLAGGFGFYVNIEKAVLIGLIPEQWKDKIVVSGNTSLKGSVDAIMKNDFIQKAEALVKVSSELALAMDPEFNELYTKNMFFE